MQSLAATIFQARPELIPFTPLTEPIPVQNPNDKGNSIVFSHGQTWDGMQDLTGWYLTILIFTMLRWLSEKMDGVRAYWDGNNSWSRHGKDMDPPKWFVSGLAATVQLDGELWMGRATFEQLITKLNRSDWNGVGYYVFDAPASPSKYEERVNQLRELISLLPLHVHIVENIKRTNTSHLWSLLENILEQGGEGLVAREPSSMYSPGTAVSSLLKVKVFFNHQKLML